MGDFMNSEQVARYFRCSVESVRRYRRGIGCKEPLPCIKSRPGEVFYDVDEIKNWARKWHPKRARMIKLSEEVERRMLT